MADPQQYSSRNVWDKSNIKIATGEKPPSPDVDDALPDLLLLLLLLLTIGLQQDCCIVMVMFVFDDTESEEDDTPHSA